MFLDRTQRQEIYSVEAINAEAAVVWNSTIVSTQLISTGHQTKLMQKFVVLQSMHQL